MYIKTTLLLIAYTLSSQVQAHGYVHSLTMDGVTWPAWLPFVDNYTRPPPVKIVRHIPNVWALFIWPKNIRTFQLITLFIHSDRMARSQT